MTLRVRQFGGALRRTWSVVTADPVWALWLSDVRRPLNLAITAGTSVALGVAVLVEPAMRFSSRSYIPLIQVPGGLATTGWGMLVSGALALVVMPWLNRRVGIALLLATGGMYLFVAQGFAAALSDPAASPWGWLLFTGLALRHVGHALYYTLDDSIWCLRRLPPSDPPLLR